MDTMDHMFTVVVTCTTAAGHETRLCLVRARNAGAIVKAANAGLQEGARIAAILDLAVPPPSIILADGWPGRAYARPSTEDDYDGIMTVEDFAKKGPRLFGNLETGHSTPGAGPAFRLH